MKKMILLASIFLLGTGAAMAQKKTTKSKVKAKTTVAVKAPELVNTNFITAYPDVTEAKWSKTAVGNYAATYTTTEGNTESVEYNEQGNVMKTKTTFPENNLPQEVSTGIQTKYAGATVENAEKITLPGVAPYYSVKLKLAGEDAKERNVYVSEQGLVSL